MPRLFVALRFAGEVEEGLDEIAHGLPGADWTPSDQYHLTLRFLGDPRPLDTADVQRALRSVRADSFHLTLHGVGHFPLRGNPEVLWVGVREEESLSRLRNRVEKTLGRAGVPPEGRKFHPHVTLARLRDAEPEDVAGFQIRNSLFRLPDVAIQEFHLISSELRPEGARHTVVESYPLEGLIEGEPRDSG